jgi:glycosyltransferase involved in cell wall biosynthesis
MRVVIIHDWLVTYAGAERVLEQMLICYPQAEVFSMVDFLPKTQRSFLDKRKVTTSFIQNLPFAKSYYRLYLPLMPLAVEQLDVSKFDLIISSSHAIAKGVLIGPDQLHVCMCYSPLRYAWDLQHQYLRESGLDKGLRSFFVRYLLHKIRIWDMRTANGVDKFIAISYFISRRIEKVYRRVSEVIYPPVDTDALELWEIKSDFYLTASRMVPYKKIPMIVEAFASMPDKKLIVIGDGPDFKKCTKIAKSNVQLLGYQSFDIMKDYMQRAKAFIFVAEEDFGITPLEAQSCGTPVIAFGKGGVLETIRGQEDKIPTGVFFYEQSTASLIEAVALFEKNFIHEISSKNCHENASRFSKVRFQEQFCAFIEREWDMFQQTKCHE